MDFYESSIGWNIISTGTFIILKPKLTYRKQFIPECVRITKKRNKFLSPDSSRSSKSGEHPGHLMLIGGALVFRIILDFIIDFSNRLKCNFR